MSEREPTSAPGDFYVENHCCTSCGVPQAVAPDLVGWVDEDMSHCYWKKQPETHHEMMQAFAIFDGQELGCHRYAGRDPEIQARLGADNCDHSPSLLQALASEVVGTPKFLMPKEETWLHRVWGALKNR